MFAVSYCVGNLSNHHFKGGFDSAAHAKWFIQNKTSACVWDILKLVDGTWVKI